MPRKSARGDVLRAAAQQVAHERGLAELTLANVAEAAGVPLGSLYYYFKTRDDVVDAVADALECQMLRQIEAWEAAEDPAEALKAFADMSLGNADALSRYGCPIGTLTAQLRKTGGPAADRTGGILARLSDWASDQFTLLGLVPDEARREGRAMLCKLEGAAMMAHATGDPSFVTEIVRDLQAHVDSLVMRSQ